MIGWIKSLLGIDSKPIEIHIDTIPREEQVSDSKKTEDSTPYRFYPDPKKEKESIVHKYFRESTSEEVEAWFNHYKLLGYNFFDSVYYAAIDKIASKDDDHFIELIQNMSSNEAKEFYREERRNGVYFSDEVYSLIQKQINKDKSDKYLLQLDEMTPEKTLSWYMRKESSQNRFDGLATGVVTKAHDNIMMLADKTSIGKTYKGKILEYIFLHAPLDVEIKFYDCDYFIDLVKENLAGDASASSKLLSYRLLSRAFEHRGDFNQMLTYRKGAIELSDEYTRYSELSNYGQSLITAGRFEEGILQLKAAAMEPRSDTAKIYRYIGELFEAREDWANTIAYFEKALAENPKVGVAKKLKKYKNMYN